MRAKSLAWAAVGGALLLLSGCGPKEDHGGGCPYCPGGGGTAVVVALEMVDQGVHSGIRAERRAVIRDGAAWTALWAEHVAGRTPPAEPPAVDFSREMVLGYFWGEKPTSGYAVAITEVVQTAQGLRVRVEVSSPPSGVPVLQVLTQPYQLVRLPRSDLPVEFLVVEAGPQSPKGSQ